MKQYLVAALVVVTCAGSITACTTVVKRNNPDTVDPGPGPDEGVDDAGEDGPTPDGGPSEPAANCPTIGTPTTLTTITGGADAISETSGIVASKLNPDVFWIHNDSGDSARAFAVNSAGDLLLTMAFDTAKPKDIEDIAIEDVSADSANLYFADIGDNAEERTELTIHRVAEPKLTSATNASLTVTSEKMKVVYSDGPHNAETLLFEPTSKALYIATKKSGGPSYIHRIGPFAAGTKATTTKIATVDVDYATGGDISRDGKYIMIRNPGKQGYLWVRGASEDFADVFKRKPCIAPIASEQQGEAVGFLPDNSGYVTISEGASPPIHVARFK